MQEAKTDHSPAKGINMAFLGDTELLSTGFSKFATIPFLCGLPFYSSNSPPPRSGDREMFVWDARNMSQPLSSTNCGVKPGALVPYFDSTIGLLYAATKGEGVGVYEYTDQKNFQFVSEIKNDRPQTSVVMLPKYQVDQENCEVARYLKLSNENYIQTVSIRVPRKTKNTLFQEDLYPPTPANEPGMTMENWSQGKKAAPKLISLRPANGCPPCVLCFSPFLGI